MSPQVLAFNLLDDAFFANPYPTLAVLRREAPCWFDPRLGAHVVTSYQNIRSVLKSDQFSSERVSQFGRGAPAHLRDKLATCTDELERWLLFRDAPSHPELRRRLGRAFGPSHRPAIARAADAATTEAIMNLAASAQPDVVRDLAIPLPTRVLAELLGIPVLDIARFKSWTTDIFALIGAGIADERAVELGHRGVTELRAYVLELLARRRDRPGDDLLSALADRAEPAGPPASDDDIVGMFMTIIVAGHETTTNLIANAIYAILADDRARAWLRDRGGIGEESVDELIRYDGSVFSLIRRARSDVAVTGGVIRAGEFVFAMLNAGNRDPEQFPAPDRIDFDRPRPIHLGLGVGLHACIGAAMARTIIHAAINAFVRTWPDAAIAPGCEWHRNMSIRGLATLPVHLRTEASAPRPPSADRRTEPKPPGGAPRLGHELAGYVPDVAENCGRSATSTWRPIDAAAVRQAVLDANQTGVALYPVSCGKNWGLGSRAPVVDGGVILDLGAMASIRELDLDRGIAIIEPGVTQGALAERLAGTGFLLNVTTSCRDSSVVGNALDRGQGALRLRSEELLGVEAVLGTGEHIASGILAPSSARFGHGRGPDLTEVFCQSNFGVVTAAAISLIRRPECTIYIYASYDGEALPDVIDSLARLRRDHVIDHIFYLGEMTAVPGRSDRLGFTVFGPLLGRRRIAGEALEIARDELARVPGCRAVRFGEPEALEPSDPLYHRGRNFLGIPSCEPLRKRFSTATCDLDETSRLGWAVVQTLLPLDGEAAADALATVSAAVERWNLSASPHLSCVTPAALNLMTMIWFQRAPDDIARMRGFRDQLQETFVAAGYPNSREGIDLLRSSMTRRREPGLMHLKASLDPRCVIAPGRYT